MGGGGWLVGGAGEGDKEGEIGQDNGAVENADVGFILG